MKKYKFTVTVEAHSCAAALRCILVALAMRQPDGSKATVKRFRREANL